MIEWFRFRRQKVTPLNSFYPKLDTRNFKKVAPSPSIAGLQLKRLTNGDHQLSKVAGLVDDRVGPKFSRF